MSIEMQISRDLVIEMEAKQLKRSSEEEISHLALDIGGSLVKLVYFSSSNSISEDDQCPLSTIQGIDIPNGLLNQHALNGRLNFRMFETEKINECIDFLSSKKLQRSDCLPENLASEKIIVKATGGGAFKFADLFREKLGITLDKVDEMDSLVAGVNFLLKVIQREAFTYINSKEDYVQINQNELYPYLLVNIGSGVSMIKVDGDGKFQRVSGTSVGGGTFWGLGKLLTNCKSFDELLELSRRGNNRVIDMLVGDIYGGMDYTKIGLLSTNIASSFGKAISENKDVEDYRPEDIARSLLRMISNNIGQIAYLNALRFGIKRIFFGGFFIRSHEYTMDTISVAVNFWSKGEAKAMFLRHEGFLGALGAFMNYKRDGFTDLMMTQQTENLVNGVCLSKDGAQNSGVEDLNDNESIECRLQVN